MRAASDRMSLSTMPSELFAALQVAMPLDVGESVIDLGRFGSLLGGGESRVGEYTGIKALMMAVLEDGILTYLCYAGRPFTEAEWWITSGDRRGPFCFPVVCETLGLEPSAVRKALQRMRANVAPSRRPIARTRPNGRAATRTNGPRSAPLPRAS